MTLADEVLFPAAMATDTADRVPHSHLDLLGAAGLYGLSGPGEAGGLEADFPTVLEVVEALAGGCLTTAFVWWHHQTALRAIARSANQALRERCLAAMCAGELRAGARIERDPPGPNALTAATVEDGWLLNGFAPWVTGWGLVDLLHTPARAASGDLVWVLVEAVDSPTLASRRLQLLAMQSSRTVSLTFKDHFVPAEQVTGTEPRPPPPPAGGGRTHVQAALASALSLGVAGRCCRLLGPGPFDTELQAQRQELQRVAMSDPAALPGLRASASLLAYRAAAALVVAGGSRSVLRDQHPQRLAREATLLLAFGTRPPIPEELTRLLLNK